MRQYTVILLGLFIGYIVNINKHCYRVIIFNTLKIYIFKFFNVFKMNFKIFLLKINNYFLTFNIFLSNIYLVFNLLTIKYNKNIIEYLSIFTLTYSIYVSIKDINIFEIYLFGFMFFSSIFIKLIKITKSWINNKKLSKEFPLLHKIIKYVLFVLLTINFIFIISIGLKLLILVINYLKNLILNMNINNKLKDLKLSLDYKWIKNKGNKPGKPNSNILLNIKSKKENKKKVSYLKEKLLNTQKRNLNNNSPDTVINKTSLGQRRGWKENINIKDNPQFLIKDQIDNVISELKAYDNQEKKFKKIVVDINKEKENFFPNESKSLFNEYVSVIKILKKNLKSLEKNLKTLKKD